ncbi:MAG: PAS domain-containing protein [Vicinamibacterales bacterium]
MRVIVDSSTDDAVFTVTPDHIVDSWNSGAQRMFGYNEREIVGRSACRRVRQ